MFDTSELESKLQQLKNEMTHRIEAIHKDTHHIEEPVEKDFAEQATQSENDDVLNALDNEAQQTLIQINHALQRLSEGTYGQCQTCGEMISIQRLEAIPYASECITCAENH